ncbi:energy-coupling factor transporter transmembrane component T family protein [Jiella marina]|uniref:energy-coupling factor transporter transmembrane component T family protein n=1 Tax=Jiella sp. LLJ827 TaxID=2917712 RepID=UPI002101CE1F|nr:energy-coupling factor transporter transmembrane protein EcfT [Jiella sp. LLJ827]MCQ0989050.1 energy-coupling factor transporter transmembrane protein EcfT [Jiella sp. LLJ827]
MIAGLYRPGDSPIHRLKAAWKLAALLLLGTVLLSLPSLWLAGLSLLAVMLGYAVAGFGVGVMEKQIKPVAVILIILFAAQLWLESLAGGILLLLRFTTLILAAGLVTLTTRTSDLVASIERGLSPLGRLGVDVSRISLAISLAIRFIPAVGQIVSDVREAQIARGRRPSPLTLVVPVIIRLLKMADAVAEAIDARS